MRYDNNSNDIVKDSLIFLYTDTTTDSTTEYNLAYTTDLSQQKYNLHIGYLGLENFYIYAKLPFAYMSVTEKFSTNEYFNQRVIKNDKSEIYFEGINFDAGYTFSFERININLLGSTFFPFGKWNKPPDIDTSAIFNDCWLNLNQKYELTIGTNLDIKFKPIHFQIGCHYNNRGGGFSDRLLTNFLVGLNSVEDTEIFANLIYKKSLSDYKNEYAISFWKYPYWSNSLNLELGYKMFFTEEFYINVGYNLCLWGENTLATRTVNIAIGYLF